MLSDRPQTRFLLRGSALLIALLALWWFLLLNPLLYLLRGSAQVFGSLILGGKSQEFVTEIPSGGWTFRVPLEFAVTDPGQESGPKKFSSIDFDVARPELNVFTFGLPVYWAIVLAAAGLRRRVLKPLIVGSAAMVILQTVLLIAFVDISARNIAATWTHAQGGLAKWFLQFGNYLVVNVLPYAAPFLVAIAMCRDLRQMIFQGDGAEPVSKESGLRSGATKKGDPSRSRKRRTASA